MPTLEWFIHDVVGAQMIMGIRPAGSDNDEDRVILSAIRSKVMNEDIGEAINEADAAQDGSHSRRTQQILHRYFLQREHLQSVTCEYDEHERKICVSFLDRNTIVGRRWYSTVSATTMGTDISDWTASGILHPGEVGTISDGRAADPVSSVINISGASVATSESEMEGPAVVPMAA